MAEYIEREAAVMKIREWFWSAPGVHPKLDRDAVEEILFAIPAANVRRVVRCRDCKHRDPEDRKCDCGGLEHAHMFPVSDDWFCADGERKDGDGARIEFVETDDYRGVIVCGALMDKDGDGDGV